MSTTEKSVEIKTVKSLEACVGKTPGPRDLKVIDFLDEHALRWISVSPCMFISVASSKEQTVRATIAGGKPGFARGESSRLVIPRDLIDNADNINSADGWGSLFVIPSLKESLRVNGTVTAVSESSVTVTVTECYLHCAKAFMRSKLWEEYGATTALESENEFCARSRFVLVATSDDSLHADISPKGDPAGKLLQITNDVAWYPDRPGNRRVDGFRNILTRPDIELLAMIAGSSQVLRITGSARLYSEHQMKEHFKVDNKSPLLVAQLNPARISLETSAALQRAALWPPAVPHEKFKASKIWQDHMKQSKISGLEAKIAKTAVSLPGVLEGALDWDYKNNLY